MHALRLEEINVDLKKLDEVVHQYVPSGFKTHEHVIAKSNIKEIIAPVDILKAFKSLGTLGGGNHFIEIDKDSDDHLWLVIHTGSRHLGIEVCKYYQDLGYHTIKDNDIYEKIARTITKLKAEGKERDIENSIKILRMQEASIPKDLCYIEGEVFDNYIHDMRLTQEHASINRETIAKIIIDKMNFHVTEEFQTIHNYIDTENMILRKGSVSADVGEKLIIPINMRDGSLICTGKGNKDWNKSAPHGAGRLMSRSQAKENFTVDEFEKTMKEAGIYTTSVGQETLDECPMTYKPMQEIIDNIEPTVDIIDIIKPIYNFKAGE